MAEERAVTRAAAHLEDDDEAPSSERKRRRPGLPVDVHRLSRVLRRGRWWLAFAAVAGTAIGVAIAKLAIKHSYEAVASIRYEGLPGQEVHEAQRDLPSLVSITHSEPMLIAVRERMGLRASVEAMRVLVGVQSDPGSGLVTFTTTAESAARAAEMANAVVELFLEHHRERRRDEVRALVASLRERIEAVQGELREARARYDAFRESHRITNLSAEQEQSITQAAELRSEADLALAEVEALEARVTQLRGALERTPRMQATSSGASADATRLRELKTRLREARGSRSDEHPEVQALSRQVDSLERQVRRGGGDTTRMSVSTLHTGLRTSLAEAETELEAARQRSASLEALATQAAARTNRFSAIEGQAATMLAQVNVKQALLEELDSQRTRAADDLRDIQTGFRSVAEAEPPEAAVRSKKKYLVAAGVPLALVVLVLVALVRRELRGLCVRTPREVAWWGNGPVIGATIWPRDPRALIDLIADMDDFAPDARGTMLVVPSSESERELAGEIAGQLNHDWSAPALLDSPAVVALPRPRSAPDGRDVIDVGSSPRAALVRGGAAALALAGAYDLDAIDGALHLDDEGEDGGDLDAPGRRLVCTAWSGPARGQALRRAARLADRVLVIVTSDAMPATELARMKARLGRQNAVGYVLVAVSDDVAKLEDREGPIEEFWTGGPAK
jgi:uncharacterized protein involved in exopolysaccharide biosynthesis